MTEYQIKLFIFRNKLLGFEDRYVISIKNFSAKPEM